MNDTAHREKEFQNYIIKKLVDQGWQVGESQHYDREYAIYPQDVQAWLQITQPQKWKRLASLNGAKALDTVMARLADALEQNGTVQVLRKGYKIAGGGELIASELQPEDVRDPASWERYKANILRVVPELVYNGVNDKHRIDLVFFVNGIAVATVEIKTDFTQDINAAVEQYKNDRKPFDRATGRREPLLTFKRGAVVHFALSEADIQMTTKLDGENTFFLPFNQGNAGHAGNPARTDGEYPVAYFWEKICQKDSWLRIFHNFVYVDKRQVADAQGNWSTRETLIFPRFHQWRAVNRIIDDAKVKGAGQAYLCEHSAGSGKTSTIAWTAHDLVRLRHGDGTAIFNSVIVVTDRTVLDQQLQDAIQQIDHQQDMIAAIDRKLLGGRSKSDVLAEELGRGTPIIVVTIQTFPFAMQEILTNANLKDKNFAVVIDEAHTSQTGTAASKLQASLALDAASMENLTVEELLEKIQVSRVRPKNVSHFAFTATPKHSTMMLFGTRPDPSRPPHKNDNMPTAFDRYPMRQAIEEGFILDVLEGYTPYKTAFNIAKSDMDEKRVDSKAAKRALAKWMNLHATNVTQKAEFIVEHFAHNVARLLNGSAKAMVVTSSRAAAVRYKKAFDAYITAHPQHKHLQALVAFSGKLTGKDIRHATDESLTNDTFVANDDEVFTETSLNVGAPGSDLRLVFDRPEYRVMIVADKFQTGFDQPKLCAMYLDKKIANDVEIVQTLSRLNRTAAGKDTTYVIDFVNEPNAILTAFAKYDAGAQITEVQDLNVAYKRQAELDKAGIYTTMHLEAFKAARFKTAKDLQDPDTRSQQHRQLYAATQIPTDIFNGKVKNLREAIAACEATFTQAKKNGYEDAAKQADAQRNELDQELKVLLDFKGGLVRFSQLYGYIGQLIDLGDPELENFAAFAKLLAKRLDGVPPEQVDVSSLVLTGYDIKVRETPDDETEDVDLILQPIRAGGGGKATPPDYLSEIIGKLNKLFGEATPLADQAALVNQVIKIVGEDSTTMAQIQQNSKEDVLRGNLPGAVGGAVARALTSHQSLAELLLQQDRQTMRPFIELIYQLVKEGKSIDLGDTRI
ncbi:DEAD/DEAH box helicase family protein [Ralstonia insidiosa]|uniref:Restriction endonuclease n=1 Tax=Ralstonia insidiosa TaxID=190721 RepID=A0A191ZS76_9RALS|nr:DEAD/DEAH box helicase family protein [Ralstonia insidiosa]ANJ70970.1 restriction endonuclease [Ralstonia insidiosa]KAB0471549.1 type I restriction endonuclease subunit R [Ralstonia insidiosa]MBY4908909.1 DEAD/DEAH box helicase family protein [Ralstonia insidiosa]